MASRADALHDLTLNTLLGGARPAAAGAVPPHQRVLTPAERKADETTRVVREATESEAAKRKAKVDGLRAARLARDAEAAAEPKPAKAARKR